MKEDNLKKFISEHKEDFEEEFSAVPVWEKISDTLDSNGQLKVKKRFYLSPAFRVAASVVILVSVALAAYFTGINTQQVAGKETKNTASSEVGLGAVSKDLAEVEKYYTVQINEKLAESKALNISPDNFSELELLKKEYESLKKEMGNCPDKEVVVQAMIENYRLRLQILNNILEEIKKQKTKQKGI